MPTCIATPKFLTTIRRTKQSKKDHHQCEDGQFFSPIPRPTADSHCIINSRDEDNSEGSSARSVTQSTACGTSWKSCEREGYHNHSPLVAQTVLYAQQGRGATVHPSSFSEELRNLNITMESARELPRNCYFGNNHVMVNRVREGHLVPPLNRSHDLDTLARWHAEAMAALDGGAFHADPNDLQAKLKKPSRRIGSNVAVGESVRRIHQQMMYKKGDYNNIVDRRYTEMGMGTARGRSGEIYLCQIFRG